MPAIECTHIVGDGVEQGRFLFSLALLFDHDEPDRLRRASPVRDFAASENR